MHACVWSWMWILECFSISGQFLSKCRRPLHYITINARQYTTPDNMYNRQWVCFYRCVTCHCPRFHKGDVCRQFTASVCESPISGATDDNDGDANFDGESVRCACANIATSASCAPTVEIRCFWASGKRTSSVVLWSTPSALLGEIASPVSSTWWVSACLRMSVFRWKVRPHWSQENGLKPVCLRLCVIRLDDWLKALLQWRHTYGFSPVT